MGIDLSAPMLARARARAAEEGVPNAEFEQGDVQVHPLPAAGFDVAVSRFGVMFYADPVAAFGNVARALRPDGRLAFVCLAELAGTDLGEILAATAEHLPTPTGPDGTGPTSFADPARVRRVLGDAGFGNVTCTRVEADQRWGRDAADATAFLSAWGPVRYHLGLVDPDTAAKAVAALGSAVRRFEHPDGVRTRGTAWLVTAARGA
ncbi:class I SAM-dependent methyltransferase [Actinomadura craniellae]|uniref:class I SAM-dependent methyltransferase n=1 Tax=Actinomadura craniellae TaxID=2231787 RepID=UPI002D7764E9|nr:class I SAM-dependent methyltransferase [Actinomadura craniellae]